MRNIDYIHDSIKGRMQEGTKDKMKVFKTKNFSIFLLFGAPEFAVNAHRSVNKVLEFTKENCKDYYKNKSYNLNSFVVDMHAEVLSLGFEKADISYAIAVVPNRKKENIVISTFGDFSVGTVAGEDINLKSNIAKNKTETKYIGDPEVRPEDLSEIRLKNNKDSVIICSQGFSSLISEKRKDFRKIFNYGALSDTKIAANRVMKNRNNLKNKKYNSASYIFIKQI